MAEDIPPLQQLRCRTLTHEHGLTPDEIERLIRAESSRGYLGELIQAESSKAPLHRRADPRAIEARLLGPGVPIFRTRTQEYPLISVHYCSYCRDWLEALEGSNRKIHQPSVGIRAGLDRWRSGRLKTHLYFDDSLLRDKYFRRLPSAAWDLGALWRAGNEPSTTCATAKATLRLCPHLPAAPLPDFQSLSSEQKEETCRRVEKQVKSAVDRRSSLAIKALTCGGAGPRLPPLRDTSYELPGLEPECWVHRLPAQTLVIAIACRRQVAASQSCANFHSVDELRQVLLDRRVERDKHSVNYHDRTIIGSWEDGAPAPLRRAPGDEVIQELFDACDRKCRRR